MSRIDEALRRSGVQPGAGEEHGQRERLFISAWRFDADTDSPARRPETSPREISAAPSADLTPVAVGVRVDPPHVSSSWQECLVTPGGDLLLGEQFLRLAATLIHAQDAGRLKTVMVTSATPGEGKTLTALNVSLALSISYRRRVLLVDADLRRPRICEAMGIEGRVGLAEALVADVDDKLSLVRFSDTLTVLPAGKADRDPLSALTSGRMQRLLNESAERFDWVILDTPPVGAAADAGLLAPMVDGTIVVVRAGETPYEIVERAIDSIGHDRILGLILNGVEPSKARNYGSYGLYFDHDDTESED